MYSSTPRPLLCLHRHVDVIVVVVVALKTPAEAIYDCFMVLCPPILFEVHVFIDRLFVCVSVCTSVIMLKVLLILLCVSLPSVFIVNCEVLY